MARAEQAYLRAALSATPRWFDGTTAVVVLLVDGVLTVGWVGDFARCSPPNERSKQWTAFELSRDHKPTHPLEYKRITNLGGSVGRSLKEATSGGVAKSAGSACPSSASAPTPTARPMRCYPGLSLSRSIGDVTLKYHPTKVVVGEPEVVQQRLNADDRFVILACDGIWDVLSNEKAVSVVAKAIKDKQDAAKALVRASFLNGSTDNMTAVVFDELLFDAPNFGIPCSSATTTATRPSSAPPPGGIFPDSFRGGPRTYRLPRYPLGAPTDDGFNFPPADDSFLSTPPASPGRDGAAAAPPRLLRRDVLRAVSWDEGRRPGSAATTPRAEARAVSLGHSTDYSRGPPAAAAWVPFDDGRALVWHEGYVVTAGGSLLQVSFSARDVETESEIPNFKAPISVVSTRFG
ncbi:protein serine/threonine phosphatase [Aureococcus anophagefferens]|nr:protein serine/threonine phosphatase [Aureococcus anophagefferens]